MARLPALIDELAKHDSRGRPTVELIARNVREQGLIRTTKRGRGAAEMSVADAAALLIGVCVADTPSAAPEAVRTFSALEPSQQDRSETGHRSAELPPPLREVTAASTFGEALSCLLTEFGDIVKLRDLTNRSVALSRRAHGGHVLQVSNLNSFDFSVGFRVTERIGYVAVNWADNPDGKLTLFGRNFYERPSETRKRSEARNDDRKVEINLGPNIFIRLGGLLKVADVPKPAGERR